MAAHLAGGLTGPPGKSQAARRLSPPLCIRTEVTRDFASLVCWVLSK